MRALVQSLVLTCAILTLASPVGADHEVCTDETKPVPRKVISDLIGWIAIHTSYDVSGIYRDPPDVSLCFIGEMIVYHDRAIRVEPFVKGVYDQPQDTIYLVSPWDPDSPADRSVLLHELIHAVQLSTAEWACPGAPELQAYFLQSQYLASHGVVADFNWPAILELSQCPETK